VGWSYSRCTWQRGGGENQYNECKIDADCINPQANFSIKIIAPADNTKIAKGFTEEGTPMKVKWEINGSSDEIKQYQVLWYSNPVIYRKTSAKIIAVVSVDKSTADIYLNRHVSEGPYRLFVRAIRDGKPPIDSNEVNLTIVEWPRILMTTVEGGTERTSALTGGGFQGWNVTTGSTVTFKWSVTPEGSKDTIVKYIFSIGGAKILAPIELPASANSYTWTVPAVNLDRYDQLNGVSMTLEGVLTNAAGDDDVRSWAVMKNSAGPRIYITSEAIPILTINSPKSGDQLKIGSQVNINWTISGSNSQIAKYVIGLMNMDQESAPFQTITQLGPTQNSYSWIVPNMTSGNYSLSIIGVKNDNTELVSRNINVRIVP